MKVDLIPLMDAIQQLADDPNDKQETNRMRVLARDHFNKGNEQILKQIGTKWFANEGFYQWASVVWPEKEKTQKLKIYKTVTNTVKTSFDLIPDYGVYGKGGSSVNTYIHKLQCEIEKLKMEIEGLKPDAEKHRNRCKNISAGMPKTYNK